ncbi:MAG: calcium-translocating P-type ATPase, PMCA-type [Prevotella sp.]|nr:calcium-translocating P-type ATPase, PMCA-type [Prevotella sp.]
MEKMIYRGLTAEQVLQSRVEHGANVLTPAARESLWKRFFEKLTGPLGHHIPGWQDGDHLIFILEIAALLSVSISCAEYFGWFGLEGTAGIEVFFEPLGILMAIILATVVSFVFELKADREFSLLNQVDDEEAIQVIREGKPRQVPKRDIVVGDVVVLTTGMEVPADATLLDATSLMVDESSLTGEPICRKEAGEAAKINEGEEEPTFPRNHVMRGTKIMEGHGHCQVFAVGDKTENGKVFKAAQIDDSVRTPLNEQLDALGLLITKISYGVAFAIVIGRIVAFLVSKDWDLAQLPTIGFATYLLQTIMIAVTLIVVAVPEGLPMAVSLSLAYSMRRMLKTNNLVRKMHACETMGATTVICTDKTGTLTQNQMQVSAFMTAEDVEKQNVEPQRSIQSVNQSEIYEGMAVNSTAELDLQDESNPTVLGNPTEGALLLWLRQQQQDYREMRRQVEVVDEVPFSTERKYMATMIERADGTRVVYVKGAPEIVMRMCQFQSQAMADVLLAYQQQAMRTLGFAFRVVGSGDVKCLDVLKTKQPTFLGVAAISDPLRTDVPPAVRECLRAGIDVKIVTGDTAATAREIGRQTGLWTEQDGERNIITGGELAELTDDELTERANELKIIARARPMDKKRLVEALQRDGQVVAVTGDGTNDAPALKSAHVGLSMGAGTSVAKEASDITILDNSFSSIARAVMWGRSLYQNIQRFILFQTTVNVVASLVVLFGAFMGTESPLTVTQMLWVNLIMDTFAAMALASLPPSHQVMKDPPRSRKAFIINRAMWRSIICTGLIFFVILLGLLYVLEHANVTSVSDFASVHIGRRDPLTPKELSLFFTIFVMLQFWNLFNARAFSTGRSAFNLRHCRGFLFIALVILLGQLLIVNIGGQFFNVVPLTLNDWLLIVPATSLVLWVGELLRLVAKRSMASEG